MSQSKAGFGQRLAWRLEVVAFDLMSVGLRLLPVDAASALGAWVLETLGPLTSSQRIARRNIELAFPEKSQAERDRILHAQWGHLGRYFAEFTLMDRLTPASGRVEIVNAEGLRRLAREGISSVLISGHFSNFEIMTMVILHCGVRCQITYRAANNPYFDERIVRNRRRFGVELFSPKGSDGSRELLQAMSRGESVALMNDQKFNGGLPARFFGHIAYTASGPTRLALRGHGELIPISVQRTRGARFRVIVHDPIVLQRTGDRQADLEDGVARINAFLEERIRERPDEWWWTHKRWPNEAYARDADGSANRLG